MPSMWQVSGTGIITGTHARCYTTYLAICYWCRKRELMAAAAEHRRREEEMNAVKNGASL